MIGTHWRWKAMLTTIQVYNLMWKELRRHREPEIIFVKAVSRIGALSGAAMKWPASIWPWDLPAYLMWRVQTPVLIISLSCENRQTHGVRQQVLWSLPLHLGYRVREVALAIQSQENYHPTRSRVLPSGWAFASVSTASVSPFWSVKISRICQNEVEKPLWRMDGLG